MAHHIPGPSLETAMPVLPSQRAFHVLVAWSQAVESRRGWVKLTPSDVPGLGGLSQEEVDQAVSELNLRGYSIPAAHGDLVYISRQGAKLARIARDMISEGHALAELTLETLAPRLAGLPFFKLPDPFTLRDLSRPRTAVAG